MGTSQEFLIGAIRNYHKISGLKQHKYIISQFLKVKSLGWLGWVLSFGVSQYQNQSVGRAAGEESAPKLIQFGSGCRMRSPFLCCYKPGR